MALSLESPPARVPLGPASTVTRLKVPSLAVRVNVLSTFTPRAATLLATVAAERGAAEADDEEEGDEDAWSPPAEELSGCEVVEQAVTASPIASMPAVAAERRRLRRGRPPWRCDMWGIPS